MQQHFRIVFGKRVRYLRNQRGWSQETLAEGTGLSRETISRIEGGKYGTKFRHVDSIVRAFNISFQEFFTDLQED